MHFSHPINLCLTRSNIAVNGVKKFATIACVNRDRPTGVKANPKAIVNATLSVT